MTNLVSIVTIPGLSAIVSKFIWHLLKPEVIEPPKEFTSEKSIGKYIETLTLCAEDCE